MSLCVRMYVVTAGTDIPSICNRGHFVKERRTTFGGLLYPGGILFLRVYCLEGPFVLGCFCSRFFFDWGAYDPLAFVSGIFAGGFLSGAFDLEQLWAHLESAKSSWTYVNVCRFFMAYHPMILMYNYNFRRTAADYYVLVHSSTIHFFLSVKNIFSCQPEIVNDLRIVIASVNWLIMNKVTVVLRFLKCFLKRDSKAWILLIYLYHLSLVLFTILCSAFE